MEKTGRLTVQSGKRVVISSLILNAAANVFYENRIPP